jgi:hypothetical protein
MIARIVAELGPWNWMVLGLILLTLEVFVPGIFLIWFGIAALITGAVSLALWELAIWTWPPQVLLFLVLSLVTALYGRRTMRNGADTSDEPLLNQRAAQLIGRHATLEEAIVNGHGRVKVGDTLWRVTGSDMPAGTKVRVTSVGQNTLDVVAAE